MLDAKTQEFLRKLKELCAEFEVEIGGCGCCGSPYFTVGEKSYEDLFISKDENRCYDKDGEHNF
jgi:hypothetical protein